MLPIETLTADVVPIVRTTMMARGVRPIGNAWILVDDRGRPLTVNGARTFHHHKWAAVNRENRGYWWALALHHQVPRLEVARVVIAPLHRNHASPQDVAACAPAAKAAIDGLVDAGVLPNDDPVHLRSVTFLPPIIVAGVDGLAMLVEDGA